MPTKFLRFKTKALGAARSKKLQLRALKAFNFLALLFAFTYLIAGFVPPINNPKFVFAAEKVPPAIVNVQAKVLPPTSISIPEIGLQDLAVETGGFENGDWIIPERKAAYMKSAGKLGEGFNTVIYAHGRKGLFLKLPDVSANSEVHVKTADGTVFKFKIISKEVIMAGEVEAINSEIPNSLTLFTCGDLGSVSRILVRAVLSEIVLPAK